MTRQFGFFVAVISLLIAYCPVSAKETNSHIQRVIYITLDGVRWQDILLHKNIMPMFWKKHSENARIYGGLINKSNTMEVASTAISLPSYQSQMSGTVTSCLDNDCGPIHIETFPEFLVRNYHLKPADVVSISCWERMDDAVEHIPGTIFSNHGSRPMIDPYTQVPDEEMQKLNALQEQEYTEGDTRSDKLTYAQAIHYLKKYKPKFLFLSLGESDDYAHDGNREAYLNTLAYYDRIIDELIKTLKAMSIFEETMIIVTTDHGRGLGDNWAEHGDEYLGSKQTWAFVFNGYLIPDSVTNKRNHYSTLSIRPTVERIFSHHLDNQ